MNNKITPSILILAAVGIFIWYVNPTYTAATGSADTAKKSITELQSEEKDYDDALGKTREVELIRDGLLTKFNGIKAADKERIGKLVPDHIDSVRLIIDINNIAARYGMSLTNINLSAPGAAPPKTGTAATAVPPQIADSSGGIGPDDRTYSSVKLGFSVSGTYGNFREFLKELEESLRIVDVTALSFSSKSQGGAAIAVSAGGDFYTYTLSIRTYYLK